MNKKIIPAIVGVVIVGGAAVWLLTSKPGGESVKSENQNTEQANAEIKPASQKSLKEFLESNGSQKCTISSEVGGTRSEGVVYVSNKRMKGEFETVVDNKPMKAYMIIDGEYAHTWVDGSTEGFKAKVNLNNEAADGEAMVDINEKVDYSCEDWNADSSAFTLPSNIKFTDYTQMMGTETQNGASASASAQSSASIKAQQCAACDQVPESSRGQCKAALACN